ncbi:hypothetical protein PRIPAC_74327, partial [Pristionchus pacificus]
FQMIDRLLFILVFTSFYIPSANAQSMLGDFFNSAIDVFKPLVEERRTHVREHSTLVRPMFDSQRDTKVLGATSRTPMQDAVPICNGDSKLCAFIACQAENLKNDQSIANLNLAAQVLADKKLRHSVGNNPEAINAVCVDSGMDESRCGTFTRGFQMISKLINSIEEPMENMKQRMPAGSMQPHPLSGGGLSPLDPSGMEGMQHVPSSRMDQLPGGGTIRQFNRPGMQRTVWRGANSWGTSVTRTTPMRTVTVQRFTTVNGQRVRKTFVTRVPRSAKPIIPSSDQQQQQQLLQLPQQDDAVFRHPPGIRRMDDYDFSWATPRGMPSINAPLWPSPSSSSSSQTAWGASSDSAPARAFGSQTWSSKGQAIDPSNSALERNDLLASFTPIPPTAAPLAFPTVKSVLPSMEDLFLRPFRLDPALEKMLNPIKIEPILRHRRHTDDFVRVVEHLARSPTKADAGTEEHEEQEENVRVKRAEINRDYYDQADAEDNARPARPSSRGGQRTRGGGGARHDTTADEYYDEVETTQQQRHRNSRPGRPKMQRNCFALLG